MQRWGLDSASLHLRATHPGSRTVKDQQKATVLSHSQTLSGLHVSPSEAAHTASERCYSFFSQWRCRFYHPPHTKLGPAEPAEYRRRFQSHLAGSPAFLSWAEAQADAVCRRGKEAASSGTGAEVVLCLISSQESVLTVNVLSIDKKWK